MQAPIAPALPNQRNQHNEQCLNPRCRDLRSAYGGMCAARAMAQRQVERLEAELAIARIRRGGDGRLGENARRIEPGGDQHNRAENLHVLRERFRALRALVEKLNREPPAADDPIVCALEARVAQLEQKLAEAGDDEVEIIEATFNEMEAVKAANAAMRKEKEQIECGICLEPLTTTSFLMGKGCYHYFHPTCIARAAMRKKMPAYRQEANPYWHDVTPDHDYPSYELKPETLDEEGNCKVFPEAVWYGCPECRDPHYADKTYWDTCQEALTTIDQQEAAANPQPAADVLENMRAEEQLLLLDVQAPAGYEGPALVMMVEAKIPGTPDDPQFPHGPTLGGHLRRAGYKWDRNAEVCGGKVWYREKRFDDVVNPPDFRGGALAKSRASRKRKMVNIAPDPVTGARRQEERLVEEGGGTYKFNYPAPPPEDHVAAAAAHDQAMNEAMGPEA